MERKRHAEAWTTNEKACSPAFRLSLRQQVKDIAGLRKIDGIGEARIEKYGGEFLPLMGAVGDV